ncbi:hypothetical protein [Cupriavidus sp. UYPR2.512]|uniref:hypothetical protein n=1 Tax=Cupriavidus sp. UYPR2.512 TaxID=1080187 RepID=UPI00039CDC01
MPESGAPACLLCLFRHVCHSAEAQATLSHAPMALLPERVEVRTGEHVFRQGRPALTVYPLPWQR